MEKMPMVITRDQEIATLRGMLLEVWMTHHKIPYQQVGLGIMDSVQKYLLKNKVIPAHLVSPSVAERYGLIDTQPKLEDMQKETARLQKLANEYWSKP